MHTNHDNSGNILALMHMCGNEIYVNPRLTLGVYALSEGAQSENVGLTPSFDYKFPISGPFGPCDENLEMDLDILTTGGWMDCRLVKKEGATVEHRLYRLIEKGGLEAALIAESRLTNEQRMSMGRVAKDIMEGDSVIKLISKYAKEWDRQESKKLQEISTL